MGSAKKYEVPPMDPALAQEFKSMREGAEANTRAIAEAMKTWFGSGSPEAQMSDNCCSNQSPSIHYSGETITPVPVPTADAGTGTNAPQSFAVINGSWPGTSGESTSGHGSFAV